MFLQTVIEVVY